MVEYSIRWHPDIVLISGWSDINYLRVAFQFKKTYSRTPIILLSDTQWKNTFRQKLRLWVGKWAISSLFDYIWIPGLFQYELARKLRFKRDHILTGLYSADWSKFHSAFEMALSDKTKNYPHCFLYIGRFSPEKGTTELYTAFNNIQKNRPSDWKLIFVGDGPLKDQIQPNEHIEVWPFIPPENLHEVVKQGGCYVLPSNRDAWAVALHEFTAAGLPVIATKEAGATTVFVKYGYNGYLFDPKQQGSIEEALLKIIQLNDCELLEMGMRSNSLSSCIKPEYWAATLMSVLKSRGIS